MMSADANRHRFDVVAVTGAAHGIGRQIALEAVRRGASIMWLIDRNREGLNTLADEVSDRCEAHIVAIDLGSAEATEQLATSWHSDAAPRLLVNCAGIRFSATLSDTSDEQWDATIAVNLTAAFKLTRAAASALRSKNIGDGVIVNIASTAGVIGYTQRAAYCASKAALIGLTRAAALDLAPYGIRVFAISPGFHRSGISDDLPEAAVSVVPLGRRGDPAELARLVHDVAASSYVTGTNIVVDGGGITGQRL